MRPDAVTPTPTGTPTGGTGGTGTTTTTTTTGAPVPHGRGASPFDTSGITRGADGIARYDGLAPSLVHLLRRVVEQQPDAPAVAEVGGGRVTYAELWDRASRVAGGLHDAGIRPRDRVALQLPNGLDWVLAFWGTQLAGAVTVPLNTRFTQPEIDQVVEDADAAMVLVPDVPLPDAEPLVLGGARPGDTAALFYTSGTTGKPKGAVTTHENLLSNIETARRVGGLERQEPGMSTLVSVPLFHVTGCNSQLLAFLALGSRVVVMPQFEVQAFLRAVTEEGITSLTSVPAIYWLAINQPAFDPAAMAQVQRLSYGGAPIAPELVHRIQAGFPAARVGNGFGLTETASIATYLPHEWSAEHADSVGFPAPVVDVALHEPDAATGVGELLVRGPNVVAGYWRRPDVTAETFVDGWLHTGDLARIDDDGLVYVVDRAKDMINRGGENVYSVEVENALAAAPGVHEVAVVAVPDEVMGEKVGAVLVPAPGGELDVAAVLSSARALLADFKVPQYVAVRRDPLPRNPGGKVLKPVLRRDTEWGQPLR